jgi:hypothetical protein
MSIDKIYEICGHENAYEEKCFFKIGDPNGDVQYEAKIIEAAESNQSMNAGHRGHKHQMRDRNSKVGFSIKEILTNPAIFFEGKKDIMVKFKPRRIASQADLLC